MTPGSLDDRPTPPGAPHVVALGGGTVAGMPPLPRVREHARLTIADTAADPQNLPGDAQALFLWNFQDPNMECILEQLPRLRWIHVAAVGVERVMVPEIVESNIVVTNSRGVFDRAIAEYVAAVLLAHAKELRRTLDDQRERVWRHRVTRSLGGQQIAVVGTGSIGRAIACTLGRLGVRVVLVGRKERIDRDFGHIRSSEDLPAVVSDCDALVLAAPATEKTRGLIDKRVLDALGPEGYLVNVGRGSLVVEPDLIHSLTTGSLGGAALDVFMTEPLPIGSPLWGMQNVLISPHMSADTDGFADDLVELFLSNLTRWSAGSPLLNVVDKELGYVPDSCDVRQ
jgi:phosphoglycerate dehydrogenase-like enzyme